MNPEQILRKIQNQTLLQEIVITGPNCELYATSTLMFKSKDCQISNPLFNRVENGYGEEKIIVFYKDPISFRTLVKATSQQILILALIFFLITYAGLYYFLIKVFILPLEKIGETFKDGSNNSLDYPKEFSVISSKIIELKNQITKREEEKAYFNLARNVVHDIRNPLAFLKSSVKNNFTISDDILEQKINEIDYQVSSLLRSSRNRNENIDINELAKSIEIDLSIFRPMKIELIHTSLSKIKIPLSIYDLKNIIGNLAKNSFEANAKYFKINFQENFDKLILSIEDNGEGVSDKIKQNLFKSDNTSKSDGNGIGLISIKKLLEKHGGNILMKSSNAEGTQFIIEIPLIESKNMTHAVLIDNDKYIHLAWEKSAVSSSIKLHTFLSVADFLQNAEKFEKSIPIYIDSDLGDKNPGEILAKTIFDKGFQNITLATAFDNPDIVSFPWIKQAIMKNPPF